MVAFHTGSRAFVVEKMIRLASFSHLPDEVLYRGVHLVNRVLSKKILSPFDLDAIHTVALTSLWISWKYEAVEFMGWHWYPDTNPEKVQVLNC